MPLIPLGVRVKKINRALSFNNPALLGDKGALLRGGKILKKSTKNNIKKLLFFLHNSIIFCNFADRKKGVKKRSERGLKFL